MFKIAIVIAALAVSASLAISVPWHGEQHHNMQGQRTREPVAAATVMSHQQKHKPEKYVVMTAQVPEQQGSGLGLGGLLESALFKVIKAPKKLVGAAAGLIVGKLKALNAKGLMKVALLSGLVAVLGAVAAVVAVSVAGLVALVTGLCAAAMHFKYFLVGGKANEGGQWAESRVDEISEFVLDAFNKYGEKQ